MYTRTWYTTPHEGTFTHSPPRVSIIVRGGGEVEFWSFGGGGGNNMYISKGMHGLHVTVVWRLEVSVDDGEGVRHPALRARIPSAPMQQVSVKQNQGSLLHLQRLVHVLVLDFGPGDGMMCRLSRPQRRLQGLESGDPPVALDHAFSDRLRQMGPGRDRETSVRHRGVLKRVPERQAARGVREADAAVLVRDDLASDARGLGDQLALRHAWAAVAQGRGDGTVEG